MYILLVPRPAGIQAKVPLTCEGCGEPFEVWRHRQDTARYCSKVCRDKNKPSGWARRGPSTSEPHSTVICAGCGEPFSVIPSRTHTAKYCSRTCKDADKRRETRTCHCGTTFVVYPSSKQKFCSLECSHAGRARHSEPELSLKPYLEPLGYIHNTDRPSYLTLRGRTRVPDYVNTDERKIIEVFGEFWHRDAILPDGQEHETPEEIIAWYRELGWDCTVVWVEELEAFRATLSEPPADFVPPNYDKRYRKRTSKKSADYCSNGHFLGEANVYIDPRGIRRCRRCQADRMARWRERKRAGLV